MKFDPLYKQNAKGDIQIWTVRTEENIIITEEGLLDGKKTEHRTTVKEGKQGRTPMDQAISMARSKWNDKCKTYWPSIEEARKAGTDLQKGGYVPMLAYPYEKYAKKFCLKGALVQYKFDGLRCLARKVGEEVQLFSRKGLPITTVPHINRSLCSYLNDGEILDGELYAHEEDFNLLSGLIRADKNIADTTGINYMVYDFPRVRSHFENLPYIDRLQALVGDDDVEDGFELAWHVLMTPTVEIENFGDLVRFHDMAVDRGYEGAILRNPMMPYVNKRSSDLLKYKLFQDKEFPIVGWNEGSGELDGCVGSFICETAHGRDFGAKLKAPRKVLQDLFNNPDQFKGKYLTVKFQVAPGEDIADPHWVPRFPVGLKIRG